MNFTFFAGKEADKSLHPNRRKSTGNSKELSRETIPPEHMMSLKALVIEKNILSPELLTFSFGIFLEIDLMEFKLLVDFLGTLIFLNIIYIIILKYQQELKQAITKNKVVPEPEFVRTHFAILDQYNPFAVSNYYKIQ